MLLVVFVKQTVLQDSLIMVYTAWNLQHMEEEQVILGNLEIKLLIYLLHIKDVFTIILILVVNNGVLFTILSVKLIFIMLLVAFVLQIVQADGQILGSPVKSPEPMEGVLDIQLTLSAIIAIVLNIRL